MQRVGVFGRRSETMPEHHGDQLVDTVRGILLAKIEGSIGTKSFAEDHHCTDVSVDHFACLVTGEKTAFDRELGNALRILVCRCANDLNVVVDELSGEVSRRTEIDQSDGLVRWIEEKIRPVRIRLHRFELEQFQQAQFQDGFADQIACRLVFTDGVVQRHAVEECRRENVLRR